jgi:hypothetical protein
VRDSTQASELQVITPQALPEIVWAGVKVITSELLAKLYGCSEKNLGVNFDNNRSRFEEGKHFVKLQGDDLRAFKNQPNIVGLVAKRAAHLILWTERGAARHAKMLETNAAWDVFEQLEDCYFSAKARKPSAVGGDLSTPYDRLPLYHFAIDTVIKHRLPFNKVYALVNLFAGVRRFKEMTKDQSSEVADFCLRFTEGRDTRNDWQRITDNQIRMHGAPRQLDMVQRLLLS